MTIVPFTIPRFAAITAAVLTIVACDGTEFEPELPITRIVVGVGDCGGLTEGTTCSLEATALDSSGTVVQDPPLRWISENNVVATVDFMGVVTGRLEGQATIVTATMDGFVEVRTTVTVGPAPPLPPEPDGPGN